MQLSFSQTWCQIALDPDSPGNQRFRGPFMYDTQWNNTQNYDKIQNMQCHLNSKHMYKIFKVSTKHARTSRQNVPDGHLESVAAARWSSLSVGNDRRGLTSRVTGSCTVAAGEITHQLRLIICTTSYVVWTATRTNFVRCPCSCFWL